MNESSIIELSAIYTQDEIEQLRSLKFINRIDEHLTVVSGVDIREDEGTNLQRVVLKLDLFYDNDAITPITFDLHNYSFDEIVDIAKNIKSSEFILNEIDIALSSYGD